MDLAVRLKQIQERITNACKSSGRNSGDVTLIAVSKTHPYSLIAEAARLGQTRFGESYIQEALPKLDLMSGDASVDPAVRAGIQWHFIGHLQSRKAREAAGRFELIHSVDSLKVAQALHRRMEQLTESGELHKMPGCSDKKTQGVLIQVNIGHEDQKSGISASDLPALIEQIVGLSFLSLKGLMCIPPFEGPPENARRYFAELRELRDAMEIKFGKGSLPELSMGMSQDFETAISEGATLVRVGTGIFGQRNYA